MLVPFDKWEDAAMLIPPNATPNTFGGWKCISDGREVDVWPGDIGKLLTYGFMKYAWHPISGTRTTTNRADND